MKNSDNLHKKPTLDDLEELFVNNRNLDAIRAFLSKFNPIKTMGMARMEIRHSAILAWLLDPQETHRLGDGFLKAFVSEALRGHHIEMYPTALAVSQADMMDTEVRREWRHIDILLISPKNKWVFVIENKFDSGQHSNQLKRYLDTVRSHFDAGTHTHVRGIFLSLWDDEPEDDRYAAIQYKTISEIIEQTTLSGSHPLTVEVETFINHYLEIIKEATGMSDEQKDLEQLARQLYRDHRRVLDFVIEHGKSTDFSLACEAIFGTDLILGDKTDVGNNSFIFHKTDSSQVSFLPKTWHDTLNDKKINWAGCENWWMEHPIIMWIQLTVDTEGTSGKIRIISEVGPISDHSVRQKIIHSIEETKVSNKKLRIGFQRGATDEGRLYSKLLKNNIFNVDDIHDQDKIANTIERALKSFEPEINAVAGALSELRLPRE